MTKKSKVKKEIVSEKMQKELTNVINAVEVWVKKNNGNVSFIAELVSFKDKVKGDEDPIRDLFMGAYGDKEDISIMLGDNLAEVKKSKSDFINW